MVTTDSHFYQVGSLFYAIAVSDVRFQKLEKEAVIQAISDYRIFLIPENRTALQASTEYGELMLKNISETDPDAWDLFEAFENYYRKNQAEFSETIKEWIILKANEIGSVYAGQNKSEIVLIARLRLLFDKT